MSEEHIPNLDTSIDNLLTPESFITYIYTGYSKSSFNQLTFKLMGKQLHLQFSA